MIFTATFTISVSAMYLIATSTMASTIVLGLDHLLDVLEDAADALVASVSITRRSSR